MKLTYLSGCLALLLVTTVMAEDKLQPLFDFTGADAAKEWQNVNDGVMGGVSEGKFKFTDKKTMEFFGTLSLANNGGFASVRTKAKKLGLEKGDTLIAKVKGDGREYSLNLYLNKPLIAFSYRATVQTKKGRRAATDGQGQRTQRRTRRRSVQGKLDWACVLRQIRLRECCREGSRTNGIRVTPIAD